MSILGNHRWWQPCRCKRCIKKAPARFATQRWLGWLGSCHCRVCRRPLTTTTLLAATFHRRRASIADNVLRNNALAKTLQDGEAES